MFKVKAQDIRLAVTVGAALVGTGYLMHLGRNNEYVARARQGLGG